MKKVYREALRIIEREGFTIKGVAHSTGSALKVFVSCPEGEGELLAHGSPSPGVMESLLRAKCRWLKRRLTDPTFDKR